MFRNFQACLDETTFSFSVGFFIVQMGKDVSKDEDIWSNSLSSITILKLVILLAQVFDIDFLMDTAHLSIF